MLKASIRKTRTHHKFVKRTKEHYVKGRHNGSISKNREYQLRDRNYFLKEQNENSGAEKINTLNEKIIRKA